MARVVVIALFVLLAATSEALPQEPTVLGNRIATELPDTPQLFASAARA